MAQNHFERLVDDELIKLVDALFRLELTDSHKSAFLRGKYDALKLSKELFRQAAKADTDPDDNY